jgi:hypothetical protein
VFYSEKQILNRLTFWKPGNNEFNATIEQQEIDIWYKFGRSQILLFTTPLSKKIHPL